MKDWVSQALTFSGMSQAELARALTIKHKWPDNRSVLNKIVTGDRELKASEMLDISIETGFPLPGSVTPEIIPSDEHMAVGKVAGTVEAGTFREVDEFDQSEPVEIILPRDEKFPSARQVVFDVAGDSMNDLSPRPIFPGDRLVCISYDDVEHLVELRSGMVVVVQRERDGGHFREWSVKQLELFRDRAEFHPRSTNTKHKPIVVRRDHEADDGVTVQVIALVRRVMNEMPGF